MLKVKKPMVEQVKKPMNQENNVFTKPSHFLFFTLEIIRTLLQPRRSFVLVGWSFLEGTSHFLVWCADRLEKKTRRTARRSPNHRSHYYSFFVASCSSHTRLLRSCFSCLMLLWQTYVLPCSWIFTQWTSEDKWGWHWEELRLLTASLGLGQRSSLSLALTLKHSLYQFRKSCQNSGLLQLHRHFFIMILEYKLINLTDLKVSFLTCLNFPHFCLN